MMEAIDAYYAKRSVTARFEDWKKRRMCVACLLQFRPKHILIFTRPDQEGEAPQDD